MRFPHSKSQHSEGFLVSTPCQTDQLFVLGDVSFLPKVLFKQTFSILTDGGIANVLQDDSLRVFEPNRSEYGLILALILKSAEYFYRTYFV